MFVRLLRVCDTVCGPVTGPVCPVCVVCVCVSQFGLDYFKTILSINCQRSQNQATHPTTVKE
jgi:hypothetical protein